MISKAKPVRIIVGVMLVAFFRVPHWIAAKYVSNAAKNFSMVTLECNDASRASVFRKLDEIAKQDRSVQIKQQRNTKLWEIGVYDTDANRAAEKANRIAIAARDEAVSEFRKTIDPELEKRQREELKREIQRNRERKDGLGAEQKYSAAQFDMIFIAPVKIWQRGVPAVSPTHPNVKVILASADILGSLLCVIGVVLILVGLRRKSKIIQADANGGTSASDD